MQTAFTADPVSTLRNQAREQARTALPVRMGQFLVGLWLRRVERRMERAVLELEHPGVLGDYMRASRHG